MSANELTVTDARFVDVGDVLVMAGPDGRSTVSLVVTDVHACVLTVRPNRWWWRLVARLRAAWLRLRDWLEVEAP